MAGEAAEYLHDVPGYLGELREAMSQHFGDERSIEADRAALRSCKKEAQGII